MTNALCFYNNGTLDRRAFTMLGLSAKSSESAIGFFGTGFKYAIATLLRNKCKVRIAAKTPHSNEYTLYTFYTTRDSFRDKEFEFIYCSYPDYNGDDVEIELPFTTHLGANWKLWQAYRELYTNSVLDEGGDVCLSTSTDLDDIMQLGDVVVYISNCVELFKVHDQHDKYFLTATTIAQSSRMRCVKKVPNSDNVVYYKTMYTGTKLEKETYFTYDYTKTVELTEDRTLSDTWFLKSHVAQVWIEGMSEQQLIEHLPKITSAHYENNIDANAYATPSAAFSKACSYLVEHQLQMPMWARLMYTKTRPFDEQVERFKPTRFQHTQLKKALKILAYHNFIIDPAKLTLCSSLPDNMWGYMRDDHIYISKKAFDDGFSKLLGTLYEEQLHLATACEDESRRMQNILIDQISNLMEHVYECEHDTNGDSSSATSTSVSPSDSSD